MDGTEFEKEINLLEHVCVFVFGVSVSKVSNDNYSVRYRDSLYGTQILL